MHVGTVVGHVWATQKDATLEGLRLLVIQPMTAEGDTSAETYVAADPIGDGIGERVLVVHGVVVSHPRLSGVNLGPAQGFGIDLLAGGRPDQGRTRQKDSPLLPHNHHLVAHGRDVSATGRTGSHNHRQLRDALRRHS